MRPGKPGEDSSGFETPPDQALETTRSGRPAPTDEMLGQLLGQLLRQAAPSTAAQAAARTAAQTVARTAARTAARTVVQTAARTADGQLLRQQEQE